MLNKKKKSILNTKKILFFFNNYRGIEIFKYIYLKKKLKSYDILISKKKLKQRYLKNLKNFKSQF